MMKKLNWPKNLKFLITSIMSSKHNIQRAMPFRVKQEKSQFKKESDTNSLNISKAAFLNRSFYLKISSTNKKLKGSNSKKHSEPMWSWKSRRRDLEKKLANSNKKSRSNSRTTLQQKQTLKSIKEDVRNQKETSKKKSPLAKISKQKLTGFLEKYKL